MNVYSDIKDQWGRDLVDLGVLDENNKCQPVYVDFKTWLIPLDP